MRWLLGLLWLGIQYGVGMGYDLVSRAVWWCWRARG